MLSRYVQFLQSVFRDCEWPVALADIPIKVTFDDDRYYLYTVKRDHCYCGKYFSIESSAFLFYCLQMEDAIYGDNNPSFGHFTAPAIISLLVNYLIKTRFYRHTTISVFNILIVVTIHNLTLYNLMMIIEIKKPVVNTNKTHNVSCIISTLLHIFYLIYFCLIFMY